MKENLNKIKSIFRSPAVASIYKWSKCIHLWVVLICLLTITTTLLSLGVTLTTRELIDGAISSHTNAVLKYGLILGGLFILQRLIAIILSLLRTESSSTLQKSLQGMLTEEILTKDYASLRGFHSGNLVNRVFSDMAVVKDGVVSTLPSFVSIGVSFFGAAAILISMDWRFVILLLVGGVLGLGIVLLFRNPMKRRHKRMQEAEASLHATTQESLENIRLIKASVSEKRTLGQIRKRQETLRKEQVRQGRFSTVMNNSMGAVFDMSWFFCMIWGCISISRGNLTYGSLAAIIQLIGRIQGPIANAVNLAARAYGVISSAERLQELTDLPAEEQGENLPDFDTICIENTYFHYPDSKELVLNNINCTIRRGDFVALTGISGGGKTSLFHLLLGIYKPTEGSISFRAGEATSIRGNVSAFNEDIKNGFKGRKEVFAGKGTRRLFAYVPQGNTLFSGTLRENLTMFTDSATDEEIMTAVKAACIEELVEDIGLQAILGERGMGLSEGQAQRVAVARALLSGAPILLLDESTSALDEETEAKLLANISAMRDKTCFIVTHRKAAKTICDYELHISEGKLEKRAC